MPDIIIRNLSEETHRALAIRAAQRGRGIEAEIRDILEHTVLPARRAKLGSMLAQIGRQAGLTAEDGAAFDGLRDGASTEPLAFESFTDLAQGPVPSSPACGLRADHPSPNADAVWNVTNAAP